MRTVLPALLCLLLAATSLAEELSYDEALTARALASTGATVDPSPEGKQVGEVRVFVEEIVGPADPYPSVISKLRFRTHEDVITREVLLEPGAVWSDELARETERNLRGLVLFSVARVLPVVSGRAGTVDVLVAVKDLWSLRLSIGYSLVGTLLQYGRVVPTERNFLGRGKHLSVDLYLRQDTFQLGQGYSDNRIFGSRFAMDETLAVVLNRSTGAFEGLNSWVSFGRPITTLRTPWGFGVGARWNTRRVRLFRGSQIYEVIPQGTTQSIPFVYDAREASAEALYTRSFGTRFKLNVSGGVGAYTRLYQVPSTPAVAPELSAAFTREFLPISEDASYLVASVRFFEARYAVLRNVHNFATSEDFSLGPGALARLRWAEPTFSGSKRFRDLELAAHFQELWGDDLFRVRTTATLRLNPDGTLVDRRIAFELRNVFPEFFLGRFHHRAMLDANVDDLRTKVRLLGGGNGLRGFAPESLSGSSVLLFNTELRTKPLVLKTFHLGGALFWDAGAAFTGRPRLFHSIGAGLRLHFPQFNTEPIRIDFGYVLSGPSPDVFWDRLSSSFGQITDTQTEFFQ